MSGPELPSIFVVRHGETDWNAERRVQGQADTDINGTGRRQASENGARLAALLGDRVADYDFVASPMRRTRETMERLRLGMGLPPDGYTTDPVLVEVHFGDWQGFTFPELDRQRPGCIAERERDKWNFVPPGSEAESYDDLYRRVIPWFEKRRRPTVCVTHGGVIRSVLRWLNGLDQNTAANVEIPQDRILELSGGRADWR